MSTMTDKSVIVTGGGSGIGAATALLAAQRGALVTVADMDRAGGERVAGEIAAAGGKAVFVEVDIGDERQVRAMVETAVATFGKLDGAFNNAAMVGYSHRRGNASTRFADLPVEAFRGGIEVNVVGTFQCMKYELEAMLPRGSGSIVNTSSCAGLLAIEAAADYVAAKHAVIGLAKAAALDYAKQGIRVNAVIPGVIETASMTTSFAQHPHLRDWAVGVQPNGRTGSPGEVAEAAVWLLSDAASFVTGSSLLVDGGYTMV